MSHQFLREGKLSILGTILALLLVIGLLPGCSTSNASDETSLSAPSSESEGTAAHGADGKQNNASTTDTQESADFAASENSPETGGSLLEYGDVPAFEGSPYVYVNGGDPTFTDEQLAAEAGSERYGELDELGRCTTAFAVVGPETQPTEERGSIGEVRPSGWQMAKYDFVEGKYLFNRCHLLGYQLTGENANPQNLITGTRYLNVQGMLPFENAVADYVDATGNHVRMAVIPVFEGSELVARGVQMMAESVEDGGDGVAFNVFCYNVQPGVVINYGTGDSMAEGDATPLPDVKGGDDASGSESADGGASDGAGATGLAATGDSGASEKGADDADEGKGVADYVLNTNSKKFHRPDCSSVKQIKDKNRKDVKDTRENLIANGYDPCQRCNP